MSRWEPNARDRLVQAALELYTERGFDETTVMEIAERAGLTERTFFRHFTDKREVLFHGAAELEEILLKGVNEAPANVPPLDAFVSALEATGPMWDERRAGAKKRHALIMAHPDLMERELIKLAKLAMSIAAAFRARGVAEPTASVAAEAGLSIFRVAFTRWVTDRGKKDFVAHVAEARQALERSIRR